MLQENPYLIDAGSLAEGEHTFKFHVQKPFFEDYAMEEDLINDANCQVTVLCDKTETMVSCELSVKGKLQLLCDRSLKPFDEMLELTGNIYYKFGTEAMELSEDLFMLDEKEPYIDFRQPIYDMILLSIPVRRLHPDYREDDNEKDFFFSTASEKDSNNKEEEVTDPRWEALKKFRNN